MEKQLSLLTGDQLPPKRFKKDMNNQEKRLLHLIPRGSSHPVKAKKLCEVLGIGERALYDLVNHLIVVHGIPIGGIRNGNNAGYFIIQNEAELQQATAPLMAQAVRMFERLRTLETVVNDRKDTDE